jgi:protein TonB
MVGEAGDVWRCNVFELVTDRQREPGGARLVTVSLSVLAHALAAATVVIVPLLYATDPLPRPPDMLAFVVQTAPPPPPPPPAAPRAEPRQKPPRPKPAVRRAATPALRKSATTPPAPVEAPSGVAPETGLENAGADELFEGIGGTPGGIDGGVAGGLAGGIVGGLGDHILPPPPAPPRPIRVGGQITPPRLVRRVNPAYPPVAERAKIEGTVILEATVGPRGRVRDVRVLRSHPLLATSAVEAVRQWEYEPLILNGKPQPFILTVTVSYHLG